MLVQLGTVGHRVDLWTPATGAVLAVHARAVNLVVGGRLWTLLPAPASPGPRRLLVADTLLRFRVPQGADVHVRAGRVSLGGVVADGRAAAVWTGGRALPPSAGTAARLAALEAASGGRAWPGLRPRLRRLTTALLTDGPGSRPADDALAGLLGAGPGLTPSGDDALLGLVAGLRGSGTATGRATLAWLRGRPVDTWARTTRLSGLLLRDALDGDLAEPLASLVAAVRAGDVVAAPLADVLATGATSGADTCQGLAAAGRLLTAWIPLRAERDVA